MSEKSKLGLKDAISIGIGAMVSGGFFAVLGLSVSLAKGECLSLFFVVISITLSSACSYSKLSIAFRDKEGTVRFINEGLGLGVFRGVLNNMLWAS